MAKKPKKNSGGSASSKPSGGGQLAQNTQAAINEIKNPKAQAAAQAAYDQATANNSPISIKELEKIQQAAAAASPTGGGPAVQALGQIQHPNAPGGTGGTGGGGQTETQTDQKYVVNVETSTDSQGNLIRTTYWSDGSQSSQNLGTSPSVQQQRRDSIATLQTMLNDYGLGSLAPIVTQLIQDNYSSDVVELKLQETPEWKARFIGNEQRRKAGLPVLNPAEYLGVEAAYKKIMRDAQLPIGFYDEPSDFGKFIGFDISPTELQERVSMANLSIQNADPFYTDSLRKMYGLSTGDMLAYALDPQRAMPLITRQVKAAQFGAEAARQGVSGISKQMAERYTDTFGVSQDEARQGFEQVAMIQPEAQRLGAVFAGQEKGVGLEGTVSAVFGGEQSAEYKKRLQRLSEMEQSLFAGQSAVGRGSLGGSQTGQF
jgi:hypothetical protein